MVRVAIAPQQTIEPLAPVQVAGPSSLGLIGGIGSALASGASTYMGLAPENPTPNPVPKPPI